MIIKVNMDFSKVDSTLSQAVDIVMPAAQLVILHHGETVHSISMGFLDPETKVHPTRSDSLFDLASVTKLYTTVAFMRLVEEGKVILDDPVCTVLPEFSGLRPIQPYENPL